jgi:hypothetical protein
MLNRVERSHVLAALLRKDYGAFTTVIEKTDNLPRADKVRLLAVVLRHQAGADPDDLGIEEILRLVGAN